MVKLTSHGNIEVIVKDRIDNGFLLILLIHRRQKNFLLSRRVRILRGLFTLG